LLHSSTLSTGFVEAVVNVFPHEQITCASIYLGWISFFIGVNVYLLSILGRWCELDETIDKSEYGVISTHAYIIPG
jgi:hypothetical protein